MNLTERQKELFNRIASSQQDRETFSSFLALLKRDLFDPETLTVENLPARKDAMKIIDDAFHPLLGKPQEKKRIDPRDGFN